MLGHVAYVDADWPHLGSVSQLEVVPVGVPPSVGIAADEAIELVFLHSHC